MPPSEENDQNRSLRRKWPRLRTFDYRGHHAYSLTLCCKDRRSLFTDRVPVQTLVNLLRETSRRNGFRVWAYCFMPDHLHLLVEGIESDAALKPFLRSFKYRASTVLKEKGIHKVWQMGYYDHVLRTDEDIKKIAGYIFQNPVRAGLVQDYRTYPFSGSFCFEWKNL